MAAKESFQVKQHELYLARSFDLERRRGVSAKHSTLHLLNSLRFDGILFKTLAVDGGDDDGGYRDLENGQRRNSIRVVRGPLRH